MTIDTGKEMNEESLREAKLLSPNTMAYVGDAVYELYVRVRLAEKYRSNVKFLHKKSVTYVSAHAQSMVLKELEHMLNDDEKDIVRRARNTRTTSMPKNADLIEYKYATAFEALIGYLYLSGQEQRLEEIFRETERIVEKENT